MKYSFDHVRSIFKIAAGSTNFSDAPCHEQYDKETLGMRETKRMQFYLSRLHVQRTVKTFGACCFHELAHIRGKDWLAHGPPLPRWLEIVVSDSA